MIVSVHAATIICESRHRPSFAGDPSPAMCGHVGASARTNDQASCLLACIDRICVEKLSYTGMALRKKSHTRDCPPGAPVI